MQAKQHLKLKVKRKPNKILGDTSRVITRPHFPGDRRRISRIIRRAINLPDVQAKALLKKILKAFSGRHENILHIFEQNLNRVKSLLPEDRLLSDVQKALIGAYFTKEYSIESAALFNPSIVPHPDQSHLEKGSLRFVMSLRATGEGHISSIVFRSGVLNRYNTFCFDPVSELVETPDRKDPVYNRNVFERKLTEMRAGNEVAGHIMSRLTEEFSCNELTEQMNILRANPRFPQTVQNETFNIIRWLADSNYEVSFHADHRISERVIFPVSKNESGGIEDARFVQFFNGNKSATYYATYTAYNGRAILPQMIETKDFIRFKIVTLNGKAVQNKGMALFPRKINSRYAMLSRQDGENNHIMFSDNIHFWETSQVIQIPEFPWEFIQVGNCGSPVETDKGWVVITHGVGPMRQYCIGAMLLDLEDPTRIIARLDEPLLTPNEKEREGYVPNVVYSCGSIIHNNELVIPYAMSDINSGIATVSVKNLLAYMRPTA